jgi:cysteinyl-tRNA synthetase
MHNGFLTMDAEKMSKSPGQCQPAAPSWWSAMPGEVVRLGPAERPLSSGRWTGTDQLVDQARKNLDRLYGWPQRRPALANFVPPVS